MCKELTKDMHSQWGSVWTQQQKGTCGGVVVVMVSLSCYSAMVMFEKKKTKRKKKDGQTHLTSSRVNHGLCKSNIFMFCVV